MHTSRPVWSELTPEEHEFHYNPQEAFPNFEAGAQRRAPLNDKARRELEHVDDVGYGDHPLHRLDIYPAARERAPVHVFLHGGYWRAQDKSNFAFIAGALVPLGITTVLVNYELCSTSTLDGVAASAVAAFDWIHRNIDEFGGDASCITLSGHSAGAHLSAEILAHEWQTPPELRGAILTSGIYDPEPARATSVNAELKLTEDICARRNVERRPPVLRPQVTLLAGGQEPWRWIDQSFRYYHNLRRHGLFPTLHVLPGYDHFDILEEYLDKDSTTVRTILEHCGMRIGADTSQCW